jgi:hypothetical protein
MRLIESGSIDSRHPDENKQHIHGEQPPVNLTYYVISCCHIFAFGRQLTTVNGQQSFAFSRLSLAILF